MAGQGSNLPGNEGESIADAYDWLPYLPEPEEKVGGLQKFKTLFIKNPFVPIGALGATAALLIGLKAFVRRDSKRQQQMMRLRVFGQGFTILALVGGLLFHQK